MTDKKHIAEHAAALLSLPPMALERQAAELHARSCAECSRALRQAERLLDLLDENLGVAAPPPAALQRTLGRTRRRLALRIVAPAMTTVLAVTVLIALFGAYPGEGLRWAAAGALLGFGAVLGWLAIGARSVHWTVLLAALLSVAFAAASGGRGPIEPLLGLRCALVESVPMAAGVFAMILLGRGLALRERGRAIALVAASGLCVQAALLVSCPARMGALHVLLFHCGGLLAVCLIGALVIPGLARRSSVPAPL